MRLMAEGAEDNSTPAWQAEANGNHAAFALRASARHSCENCICGALAERVSEKAFIRTVRFRSPQVANPRPTKA